MVNLNGDFLRRLFRPGLVFAAAMVGFAALIVLTVSFYASPLAHADHDSLSLVCPDPIQEGNTGQMQIKKPGHRIVYAVIFTHEGAYTAGLDDFEEYHGVKFESGSDEKTLKVPIITKEDSTPEHDEQFAIGFMNDGIWHQCMVTTEDDDAPEILDVNIISRPADGYAYRAGESIDIGVDTDLKVEVEGTPLLSLFIGDGDQSTWRGAEYHSGSGTRFLVYRYQVETADRDNDGVSVASAYSGEDGRPAEGFSGDIHAEGTEVPIEYAHSGVESHWKQKVDGRPYVQNARIISSPGERWNAYRANQVIEIELTFDTDVEVEEQATMDMYLGLENYNWDEAAIVAEYLRGSGSDTLVFEYTVQPGDMDANGVGLILGTEKAGFGGSGTIKAKGTQVERNPYYLGSGHQPAHKVDTNPPSVSAVAITSLPRDGEAYSVGETITMEASIDEEVIAEGIIMLEIDVGGAAQFAMLADRQEDSFTRSLVFEYEVQQGDTDADGIGISANKLMVIGGVFDRAGNSADLSHAAIASHPNHKVKTTQDS